MAHLYGYARVSTALQDPALQIDALTAAGCARIFTDQASGRLASRPQMDKLMEALLPGDVLVVWRLDRLGRNMRHLIDVVTELEGRGVGFRSLTESIDTTTAGGKLIFHIFGAIAEFERNLIVERTQAGLAAARARGRTGGRRPKLSPTQARLAVSMYKSGEHTVAEIARVLQVSRGTIYKAAQQSIDVEETG